jgi:hypothetical protein
MVRPIQPYKSFAKLKVDASKPAQLVPRFSLTGDIISYERCPRQYAFFAVRDFVPSHAVQIYFGTVVHEVLDKALRHFKEASKRNAASGITDPVQSLPKDSHISQFFDDVDKALRARGIKAHSSTTKDHAKGLLQKFNTIEGPRLYPLIDETEHSLQGERPGYILEGIVDVIKREVKDGMQEIEIWDYKGSKKPREGNKHLKNYEYQMLVYASLYRQKYGLLPKKAVLYFINELEISSGGERPSSAIHEVLIDEKKVKAALGAFDNTVSKIKQSKEKCSWSPPSVSDVQDYLIKDTCSICDIRWGCSSYKEARRKERESGDLRPPLVSSLKKS